LNILIGPILIVIEYEHFIDVNVHLKIVGYFIDGRYCLKE